jgi:hypothetical protein
MLLLEALCYQIPEEVVQVQMVERLCSSPRAAGYDYHENVPVCSIET